MRRIFVATTLLLGLAACEPALDITVTPVDKAAALSLIAAEQVEAGDEASARETIALATEIIREKAEAGIDGAGFALAAIAWAQAKLGDIPQARMTAHGTDSYVRSLAHVAGVQARSGDLAGARETIVLALVALGDSEVVPFSLILVQALTGEMEWALAHAGHVGSGFADDIEFGMRLSILAGLQAEAGDLAAMDATLQRIRVLVIEEEIPLPMYVTYELRTRLTWEDWQGAYDTIDSYEGELRDRPDELEGRKEFLAGVDMYRHVVEMHRALDRGDKVAARDQFDKAVRVVAGIPDLEYREYMYAEMQLLLPPSADPRLARDALRKTVQMNSFLFPGEDAVMDLARRGDAEGVEELISAATAKAEEQGQENSVLPVAAEARLLIGDRTGALHAVSKIRNRPEHGDGWSVLYAVVRDRVFSREPTEAAYDLLDGMAFFWSYSAHIASIQARAGDLTTARRTALGIAPYDKREVELLQRTARLQLRLGRPEDAVSSVTRTWEIHERLGGLLGLVHLMIEAGDTEGAQRVVAAAEELAHAAGPYTRESYLIDIAKIRRQLGNPEMHAAALEAAAARVPSFDHPRTRIDYLIEIAEEHIAVGSMTAARALAYTAIEDIPALPEAFYEEMLAPLASVLVQLGEQEAALRVINDNLKKRPETTYGEVANRLVEAGAREGAVAFLALASDAAFAAGLSERLAATAQHRAMLDDRNGAIADARRAREGSRREPSLRRRASILAEAGVAFVLAGAMAEADETFLLAVKTGTTISTPLYRVLALENIGRHAKGAGLSVWSNAAVSAAWPNLSKIRDPDDREARRVHLQCIRQGCPHESPVIVRASPPATLVVGTPSGPYEPVRRALGAARDLARGGDAPGARAEIARATATAEGLKDRLLRAKTWFAAAGLSREIGDVKAADRQLARAAEEAAADVGSVYRATLLVQIAEHYEAAGHIEKALETAALVTAAMRERAD